MNKKVKFGLVSILFIHFFSCFSQNGDNDFLFKNNDSIVVKSKNDSILKSPWAGGLNTPQFSTIDINNDGKKDLFVFERNGNRILTYINTATSQNQTSYKFTNEYYDKFPSMHDWVLLRDFNNDGKEDIFTYSNGGISVYKNISDNSGLKFQLKKQTIMADFGSGLLSNLYVSSTDIPAIADIDNDGDLDILTFHILGSYLQVYINQSMEKYGVPDSLDFVLANNCWGDFAESPTANHVKLDIDCPYNKSLSYLNEKQVRHTGSTICALDLDGDNYKDVLIGDIGYRTIYALYSDTLGAHTHVTKLDTLFPSYDTSVQITSMPAIYSLDINNDSKNDLIFAPNDTQVSDNYEGVWLYENNGNKTQSYRFKEKGFLQNDMIDVGQSSYPILYDYNKDGLLDLIVGNDGIYVNSKDSLSTIYSTYISSLSLYKNIGTISKPEFKLIDNDFGKLYSLKLTGLHPTFGDINNDGKDEMIVGQTNGKLLYLENSSNDLNAPNFNVVSNAYMNIDIGSNSSPQLIDLNRDGLFDLAVGAKDGRIKYFENIGNTYNPSFNSTPTNAKLGNVNVTDTMNSNFGYSTPFFFQKDNKYCLFVGSQSGNIFYYKDIDHNLNGEFTYMPGQLFGTNNGTYSAISLADLNNDGYLEAITGNEAGGLSYFKGTKPWGVGIAENTENNIRIYPNPANTEIIVADRNATTIEIFDIQGTLIQECAVNKSGKIDIKALKSGLYIIKLTYSDKHQTFGKFIKIE